MVESNSMIGLLEKEMRIFVTKTLSFKKDASKCQCLMDVLNFFQVSLFLLVILSFLYLLD